MSGIKKEIDWESCPFLKHYSKDPCVIKEHHLEGVETELVRNKKTGLLRLKIKEEDANSSHNQPC